MLVERFAEMAAAMDAIGGLPLERQPGKPWRKSGVCRLMGIPGKMSDLQITDTHFKEMAADAVKSPPYLSNPRRCTVEELVGVLQKAL
jgi:alcohol dehydrogenase class IV